MCGFNFSRFKQAHFFRRLIIIRQGKPLIEGQSFPRVASPALSHGNFPSSGISRQAKPGSPSTESEWESLQEGYQGENRTAFESGWVDHTKEPLRLAEGGLFPALSP